MADWYAVRWNRTPSEVLTTIPVAHDLFLRFKKLYFHRFPVKYCIRAAVHPFAQVDVATAAVFELPVDRQVPMPENEIIGLDTLIDFPVAIL